MSWLIPYNHEFEDEEDLITIIKDINLKVNKQINSTIGVAPIMLYNKEKEYLKPLPNKVLLDSYLEEHYRQVVPPTQLIYYKGSKYSLSSKYIGETVDIYPVNETLYIYLNHQLIATHNITQQKINYTKIV